MFRKIISLVIILQIILNTFMFSNVFAAANEIKLSIEIVDYDSIKLTCSFSEPLIETSYISVYTSTKDAQLKIDTTNIYQEKKIIKVARSGEVFRLPEIKITGLSQAINYRNIIYDIRVDRYDTEGGSIISQGLLYNLNKDTFRCEILEWDDEKVKVSDDKYDIGIDPKLDIFWKEPYVWNGTDFIKFRVGYIYIMSELKKIYSGIVTDVSIGFNIKIDNKIQDVPDISVKYIGNKYMARIYGNFDYQTIEDGDYLHIYLRGSVNSESSVLSSTGVSLTSTSVLINKPATTSMVFLENKYINPSSIYFMEIKTKIFTSQDLDVSGFYCLSSSVTMQNGSVSYDYIYTPIRFELTKDSMNNMLFKIYKIIGKDKYYSVWKTKERKAFSDEISVDNKKQREYCCDANINSDVTTYAIFKESSVTSMNYKIALTTDDANERYESFLMEFDFTSIVKPPTPLNIKISNLKYTGGKILIPTGTEVAISGKQILSNTAVESDTKYTTSFTVSFDMPSNWVKIKSSPKLLENDIVYHFVINTNQDDTDVLMELKENVQSLGSYKPMYRLVKYVSAQHLVEDQINKRLSYTFNGNELFTGDDLIQSGNSWTEDVDGKANKSTVLISNPGTIGGNQYPRYLLQNRVYYLQMYTTKWDDRGTTNADLMSDKSATVTITTLTSKENTVPVPKKFKWTKNEIETSIDEETGEVIGKNNYVDLEFEKVSVNYLKYADNLGEKKNTFYDIYISKTPTLESFKLLATTENYSNESTIKMTGIDSISDMIKLRVQDTSGVDNFDTKLFPNTIYYFYIMTRLEISVIEDGVTKDKSLLSTQSSLLSVTTIKGEIEKPEETNRRPQVPNDFRIKKNAAGNEMLTGDSVTFRWTRTEKDTYFKLMCTSVRMDSTAYSSDFADDQYYKNFVNDLKGPIFIYPEGKETLEKKLNAEDTESNIDNEDNAETNAEVDTTEVTLTSNSSDKNFYYDVRTNECTYTINQWIFPNRLYFFSLRTEKMVPENFEPDSALSEKNEEAALQFYLSNWVCIPVTTKLIDSPSAIEVVSDPEIGFSWKEDDSSITINDVRVNIKAEDEIEYKEVPSKQITITKDGPDFYGRIRGLEYRKKYSVQVFRESKNPKLMLQDDNLTTINSYNELLVRWKGVSEYDFQLQMMAIEESSYVDLEAYDCLITSEKTNLLVGTKYSMFYGRIYSRQIKNSEGIIESQKLKPNMKYFIKVRSTITDPFDLSLKTFSKFIGPAEGRTDFDQSQYDQDKDKENNKIKFLDKIKKIEKQDFWKIDLSNYDKKKILLKSDRLENEIMNNGNKNIEVDISDYNDMALSDEIILSSNVLKTLKKEDKIIKLKSTQTVLSIRPSTFDFENSDEYNNLSKKEDVSEIFVKINIDKNDSPTISLPTDVTLASKVIRMNISYLGSDKDYKSLSEQVKNKLYDENGGIVSQKLSEVINGYDAVNAGVLGDKEAFLDQKVDEVEDELSNSINELIATNMDNEEKTVKATKIEKPINIKIYFNEEKGKEVPYVYYEGETKWKEITSNVSKLPNSILFDISKTGEYSIVSIKSALDSMDEKHWAYQNMLNFDLKYDLKKVFKDGVYPDYNTTVKDVVSISQAVLNKTIDTNNLTKSIKELEFDKILTSNSGGREITREEFASILDYLYKKKFGVNELSSSKNYIIKDESEIGDKYYKGIIVILDLGLMELNEIKMFRPKEFITRGEAIYSIERMK